MVRTRRGIALGVTRRARLDGVSARHRVPRGLVLMAEHAVVFGRDGRERPRVVVTERAVGGEVGVAAAFRGIEVGLAVTDLAHAAAGIGRARQPARRQAGVDRKGHVVEMLPRPHQVAHQMEVRAAVRVVAVETVAGLSAAQSLGCLGGMPVDVVVAGRAVGDRAVAPADAARPAVAVAGDAVERGSVAGREGVSQGQVVVAGPALAGAGRGALSAGAAERGRGEQSDHADPCRQASVFLEQHRIS